MNPPLISATISWITIEDFVSPLYLQYSGAQHLIPVRMFSIQPVTFTRSRPLGATRPLLTQGGIIQWSETDVHSAVTAKTCTCTDLHLRLARALATLIKYSVSTEK